MEKKAWGKKVVAPLVAPVVEAAKGPVKQWLKPFLAGAGTGAVATLAGSHALQKLREKKALQNYYSSLNEQGYDYY
jgi:hypothetical protein